MRLLVLSTFIFISSQLFAALDTKKEHNPFEELNFFGSVLERVEREYVDDVPFDTLVDNAVEGLLSNLDRHSYLVKSDEYKDMKTMMKGEFGGLGIEVVFEDGLVRIITPMDDSPAQKAGLMPGDLITHINDKPIKGMDSDKTIEKLKGKPGTLVKVFIRRDQEGLEFTIKRELIQTKPVKIRREGDFVVARIATFMDGKTAQKFVEEYKKVAKDKKPIKGMVLDLRNNGGGLLNEAIAITSLFIEKGKEVVSTRGRRKSDVERFHTVGNTQYQDMPLVVLINRATASAPEIVAGALKDYKRAIIMGEQSYGKGSVQTVIPLKDNRAIRLTTARYYTPSGETIQDEGVKPDIEVPLGVLEKVDLGPRYTEKDLAKGVKKKTQDEEDEEEEEDDTPEGLLKKEKKVDLIPGMPSLDKVKVKKDDDEKEDNHPEKDPHKETDKNKTDTDKDKNKDTKKDDPKKDASDKDALDKKVDPSKEKKDDDKKEGGDKSDKTPIDYQTERALDLLKSITILKESGLKS